MATIRAPIPTSSPASTIDIEAIKEEVVKAAVAARPTPTATPSSLPTPNPTLTLVPTPTATPSAGPIPSATHAAGAWLLNVNNDSLDDSLTVSAILKADEGQSVYGVPIELVLQCRSGTDGESNFSFADVHIRWYSYLGLFSPTVDYRVGDDPLVTENWADDRYYDTYTTTWYPHSPFSFISRLTTADKFSAQVTVDKNVYPELEGKPIIAIFNLTGINQIVPQVLERCHGS